MCINAVWNSLRVSSLNWNLVSWESSLSLCLTAKKGGLLFYANSTQYRVVATLNDWFVVWTILILIDSMQWNGVYHAIAYTRCVRQSHSRHHKNHTMCTLHKEWQQKSIVFDWSVSTLRYPFSSIHASKWIWYAMTRTILHNEFRIFDEFRPNRTFKIRI